MVSHRIKKFLPWLHENTGQFSSREDPSRDSGHRPRNTGRPGKYGTVGNPSHSPWHSVVCINDVIATRDCCTSVRAVAQNGPPIHSKLILRNSQFIQDIHSERDKLDRLMCSACLVRTRFILNIFLVGLDWGRGPTDPWLRPYFLLTRLEMI